MAASLSQTDSKSSSSSLSFQYEGAGEEENKTDHLLSWIEQMLTLTEDEAASKCNLILSNVQTKRSVHSNENWEEICKLLSKLLIKPNVHKIIVPQTIMHLIVGKCEKWMKNDLLESIPSSLHLYGRTVDTKSFLSTAVFTNKITSNLAAQNVEGTVVTFLKDMVSQSEPKPVSRSLHIAIERAAKFLCKAKRKGWFKQNIDEKQKQANETSKNSTGNNNTVKNDVENSVRCETKETKMNLETEPLPPMKQRMSNCYVCKDRKVLSRKRRKNTPANKQYPRLCEPCADANYVKRTARLDLTGKYAVVTGGRIKIGFEIVLKLLRDGCNVIATSRFPRNAAREFSKQKDYDKWKDRLKLYPLDLKDVGGIYRFVSYVKSTFPHLDILINNAAQTLRRPIDFYRELLDLEQIPYDHIPPQHQAVLASKASLDYGCSNSSALTSTSSTTSYPRIEAVVTEPIEAKVTEPNQPIVSEPNQSIVTEPNQSIVSEPKQSIVSEPKQSIVSEPKQSIVPEPNEATTSQSNSEFKVEEMMNDDDDDAERVVDVSVIVEDDSDDDNDVSYSNTKSKSPASPLPAKRGHYSTTLDDVEPVIKTPRKEHIGEDVDAEKRKNTPDFKRSKSDPFGETSSGCNVSQRVSQNKKGNKSLLLLKTLKAQQSCGTLTAISSPQIAPSNSNLSGGNPFLMSRYFPRGLYDDDGQQLDLRRTNTWRSVLESVSLGEFMEVFVVNTIAPFILNKELKSHLSKQKNERTFIVNVSAMEGQFNRKGKNKFHPHTNMAKAALNMMTRTAALEYKECEIYMTSVDTGWVSDERPFHLARREAKEGFRLPLDCIDGASRVYDPIVTGYTEADTPKYAVFIKDYNVYPW